MWKHSPRATAFVLKPAALLKEQIMPRKTTIRDKDMTYRKTGSLKRYARMPKNGWGKYPRCNQCGCCLGAIQPSGLKIKDAVVYYNPPHRNILFCSTTCALKNAVKRKQRQQYLNSPEGRKARAESQRAFNRVMSDVFR